jgi:hypothetical protein
LASFRDGSPGSQNEKLCPNDGPSCNAFVIAEINAATATVAYAEIAFHTYRPDAEWIRGVVDPAQRLASGIDNYFNS